MSSKAGGRNNGSGSGGRERGVVDRKGLEKMIQLGQRWRETRKNAQTGELRVVK